MEKDFQICFAWLLRAWGTSVASVRSSATRLCKGDTGALQRCRGVWPARRRSRRTASARMVVAIQSLDQENPPYTSVVLKFVGGGYISVLRMRDLAEV